MLLLSATRVVVDRVVPLPKVVLVVAVDVDARAAWRFQDVGVARYVLQHVLIMLH